MAPAARVPKVTPQEYLTAERAAEFKSEYFGGEVVAMAGASTRHNQVVVALTVLVGTRLRGTPCQVLGSDQKVWAPEASAFLYPDLTIVCDGPQHHDAKKDVLLNPAVVVEVLSPSTEAVDRSVKLRAYWTIPGLKAVLLVSQKEPRVEVVTRRAPHEYLTTEHTGLASQVSVPGTSAVVPLAEIYERVDFSEPADDRPE